MRKSLPTISFAKKFLERKGLIEVKPCRFEGNGFHGTVQPKGALRVEVRMWRVSAATEQTCEALEGMVHEYYAEKANAT